jgi:hypothetical protein
MLPMRRLAALQRGGWKRAFGVDYREWPVLGCPIGLFPTGLEPGIAKKLIYRSTFDSSLCR